MEQMSFNQNLAYNPNALSCSVPATAARERRSVIRARRSPEPTEAKVAGNVTEIILPEGQVENFQLLLPMLTQLNQEKRWLAWIDPPQALVSKWQKMHGIVAGELLVLRSTPDYPAQELAERALSAGTCHAVVMWTRKLGRAALESLQKASAEGSSHGVVLRQR
ncbi:MULTISPECIES: cell division inhibitor SulA [Marinobacter]|jgi:cell division inhibitor SulA|uniref:cell division inhibitor SulA n=1 Tax=Marinobacter TaxID=2742 RepID=UPI0007D97528|nr:MULTISPECIES: SulA-like leucine-rich domain-containing protein [unclassified Marinobacter]MBL3824503.1 LexA family transcriptional regulator [Marinobacter sp. MC3]MBL3893009.1 LexA family transcriptional regulator [Marinobacter sp. MW3]OAN90235.1 LexA family transcriptional regulator [Marinobacter sp. EhN04]OAN97046.1 LexA family transcriptional regulator [Marinobacter sp. EhC06]